MREERKRGPPLGSRCEWVERWTEWMWRRRRRCACVDVWMRRNKAPHGTELRGLSSGGLRR